MNHRLYIGDSRDVLPQLEDEFAESISLMVTSPPYFVGRGYEDYIESWEEYWGMLFDVLTSLDPLMEPGGKVAINFADRYANYKYLGKSCEIPYIPHYQKIMNHLEYDLWGRIVWDKTKVMIDGARHTTNSGRFKGRMRIAPNWEYIFIWRKPGPREDKKVTMTKKEWGDYVNGIWRISSVSKNATVGGTKLAIFPKEIPARLIKMYTEEGDIVLDPFLGTGTTLEVARNLGRQGIGIDNNPDMIPEVKERMKPDLFNKDTLEVIYD